MALEQRGSILRDVDAWTWESPMPINEQISALERGHALDLPHDWRHDELSGENYRGMHIKFRVVECSVLYGIEVLPEIR
jgi:hypothetical protein